jgi:hypothetical protein
MVAYRQASFAGGELAPTLYGRADLAKYGVGARRLRNFFVSKHGAAVSRPGTTFVGATAEGARLIPFVVSDTEGYVLEFFATGLRVIENGARLADPFLLSTPYAAADLPGLRFAQVGDILTICHPNHAPRELVRTVGAGSDPDTWTLSLVSFALPAYDGAEPMMLERTAAENAEDPEHLAREWTWAVTMVGRWPSGVVFESLPAIVTRVCKYDGTNIREVVGAIPRDVVLTLDRKVTIDFNTQGLGLLDYEPMAIRVYRGRGGVFGYVGESNQPNSTTNGTFRDYAEDPDFARPPPTGLNPFEVRNQGGTLLRTEHPAAVGYYEQRQTFGGTTERPTRLFLSRTNSYLDFDQPTPTTSDRAIEFELASRRREEIRAVLGLDRLLVFTSGAVWAVGGDAPLAPTDLITARVQTENGCADIEPLPVEGSVLYVRAKGGGVRDLAYDDTRRGYAGADLGILASHLFDGHEIKAWCYAEDPWGVVWVVRDDGKLLSLTYSRADDLWAWAWHDTAGSVEGVCSVPEGDEDAVYLVVKRTVGGEALRYVERMATRKIATASAAVCLDSAKTTTKLVAPGGTSLLLDGLSHLEGLEVRALVGGNATAPQTVTGGTVTVEAVPGLHAVAVGLPYVCEIETLDTPDDKTHAKIIKKALWEVEASRGLWTQAGRGLWAGESLDTAVEFRQRTVVDDGSAMALATDLVPVTIAARWNKHGRAVLRQVDPLPITVLGVTREGEQGG